MVRDQVLPVGARTSQIMFDGRVMGAEAPDVNVDDERTAEVGDVDTTVQLCREALALVAFVKREGVL